MRAQSTTPAATVAVFLTAFCALTEGEAQSALIVDNGVFPTFTRHITRQVGIDKEAFAQASTCLSWFYKGTKKAPPAAAQGIAWRQPVLLEPERDCPRHYPGGMETARDDFARKQALLAVSLTVYEFALVADHNDDQQYNPAELQDLFHSLSLAYDAAIPPRAAGATLTARFDEWYQTRNLEQVMKGMSALYEQGYRVTPHDRAELDRVMK
ncbi:MAG TPA: hypothetical protein VJL88_10580 [Nitrospira sp.]|nr:hypothetical protein [Nitrospira sp.]